MKIVTPGEFLGLPAGTAFVQSRNGTLSSISVKLSPPVFNLSPANGVFFKVVCLGIQVNHLSAAVFRIDIDLDFVNSTVVPTDFSQEGTEYVIEEDDKFGIFDETERVAIVQRLSSSIKLLEQKVDKDPGDC